MKVNAKTFEHAVRFVDKAASNDDNCTALAHILIQDDGQSLTLIGCDTFRLHMVSIPTSIDIRDGSWLVHRKDAIAGIREYKKVFNPGVHASVDLTFGENGLVVAYDDRYAIMWPTTNWGKHPVKNRVQNQYKNRYGKNYHWETKFEVRRPNYPDWKQVWPTGGDTVTVNKGKLVTVLKDAVKRAKDESRSNACCYVATEDSNLVFYQLSASNQIGNEVGLVPVTGIPVRFAANAKYLLDALYGVQDDTVSIRVQDGHPLVIGETAVVMPIHMAREK